MKHNQIFAAALAILGLAACSDDQPAEAGGPEGGTTHLLDGGAADAKESGALDDSGALGPDVLVGELVIQLNAPDAPAGGSGFTSIMGKVYDGPPVEPLVWEAQQSEGGCTLLKPRVPFCDPPCGSEACVEDDTCRPYPSALDLGTVTVHGLMQESGSTQPFSIEPIQGSYSTPGDIKLPFPSSEEGAPVRIETSGGDVRAFAVQATGIAPLMLAADSLPIERGKPLTIDWNAASQTANSRIQIKLDVSHHGGTKGKITCDVEDNGSLSIAATLVDALIDLGVAGFPTVEVIRSSVGSTLTSAGRVNLRIYQAEEREVTIPGLVSCSGNEQCPQGQTCKSDLTCG